MILRDRVGGGGKANVSFAGACATDDLRRILTISLAGRAGEIGEVGWYDEAEEDFCDALEETDSAPDIAGGGSSKDICRLEKWEPSLPLISVDDPGVGGGSGRGIANDMNTQFHEGGSLAREVQGWARARQPAKKSKSLQEGS